MDFRLQKGLEEPEHRIMFRLPSVLGLSANNRSVRRIRDSSSCSLARVLRNFGIDVDEGKMKVLDGSLSPMGRLFEIYFVRLIGTPNQNYKKMPAPVGIKLVVQTNH
jgi:hypothetical protein